MMGAPQKKSRGQSPIIGMGCFFAPAIVLGYDDPVALQVDPLKEHLPTRISPQKKNRWVPIGSDEMSQLFNGWFNGPIFKGTIDGWFTLGFHHH